VEILVSVFKSFVFTSDTNSVDHKSVRPNFMYPANN
jgi:hypothetical protein